MGQPEPVIPFATFMRRDAERVSEIHLHGRSLLHEERTRSGEEA